MAGVAREGAITLRNSFLFSGNGTAAAVNNFVATSGVKDGEGDDWLRVVGFNTSWTEVSKAVL